MGLFSYGQDMMVAHQEELGMSQNDARGVLYDLFVAKDVMSSERIFANQRSLC